MVTRREFFGATALAGLGLLVGLPTRKRTLAATFEARIPTRSGGQC
jgi:hypothetical protein